MVKNKKKISLPSGLGDDEFNLLAGLASAIHSGQRVYPRVRPHRILNAKDEHVAFVVHLQYVL